MTKRIRLSIKNAMQIPTDPHGIFYGKFKRIPAQPWISLKDTTAP